MAATLALRLGMALARAGRERLAAAHRERERDFHLHPDERLGDGVRRMALGQLDLAIELLEGDGALDERSVHETRKALKRLRALLRLVRAELGEPVYSRHAATLRAVARRLSGARDAHVMLATLQALVTHGPSRMARRKGVRRLQATLDAEHRQTAAGTLGDPLLRASALAQLHGVRAEVALWQLPDGRGCSVVERDLRSVYRTGRARYRRVARGRGEQIRAMHEWRKRVKDLRYAAESLQRAEASPQLPAVAKVGARRARRRANQGKAERRLRKVARRADVLGEALGEDHDLALLAQLVRERARAGAPRIGRRTRRLLLKAIARRRRELRRRALRDGARLYGRPPRRFMRDFRAAFAAGGRRLSRR